MDAEKLLRADDGWVARVKREHAPRVAVHPARGDPPLDPDSSHLSFASVSRPFHLPSAPAVICVTRDP